MSWRAVGVAVLWFCVSGQAAAESVEFLYINANEGTASGGHAALKLGEEVFHFQHVSPGLLRIKRDDFAQFRLAYGERENRTIRLHRVEVTAATFERLRERFNRIVLIEDEQFDRRDGLALDRRLLDVLLRQTKGEEQRLALKGAGLFLPDGWNFGAEPVAELPKSTILARLARRVEAEFGAGFLASKSGELVEHLQSLRPGPVGKSVTTLAEDGFHAADYAYAERYFDQLEVLAALQVLGRGLALRDGVLVRSTGAEFRLGEAQRQHVVAYRAKLEEQVLGLFRSSRPDWGFALLLGMARLIALDESIASGRWVFLSLVGPSVEAAMPGGEAARQAFAWSRARFMAAKLAIAQADAMDEWAYAEAELAANYFAEASLALRESRVPSLSTMATTPARPALVTPIVPAMDSVQLQTELDKLEIEGEAYEARLRELYAYDLLGRNCASELFRVIDGGDEQAQAESQRSLGGDLSGRALDFIPFVAFHDVGQSWRVAATEEMPSYRRRRLEQARAAENPVLVALRESNVFSSRLYHWHRGDSAFVFFTDELVWTRPVVGGFNLAAGLAQGLSGLLTLPWDRGENLWQGFKGALVSLPELAFFNIRKGSFPELQTIGE